MLLLLLFAAVATAQETNVTGVILESSRNQPLEGVTVKDSGTNSITKTGASVVDRIIVDKSTNI